MSHRSKVDVSSRTKVPLLFDRLVGTGDEGGDIVMQLLERFLVGVDHMTGLIPRVLNVLPQGGWDGQVFHLVTGSEVRGGEVEISTVEQDLEAGVVLHGGGQIWHDVDAPCFGGCTRRLMLGLPGFVDGAQLRKISEAFAELELAADIVVKARNVGRSNGGGLRIVGGLLGQWVDGGAGEAAVDAAGGDVITSLQIVVELAHVD